MIKYKMMAAAHLFPLELVCKFKSSLIEKVNNGQDNVIL